MNSTLGKSIARLARSMTATDTEGEVATEKPPDSIDAEPTEATQVDVVAHTLPEDEGGDDITTGSVDDVEDAPSKKPAEIEAMIGTDSPIDEHSKEPEFVQLAVAPPSQLNEMSPPSP